MIKIDITFLLKFIFSTPHIHPHIWFYFNGCIFYFSWTKTECSYLDLIPLHTHARFQCVPRTVSVCLTHGFSVSHARFQCVPRTVSVCLTHGFSVSHARFQCVPRTVSVCPTHGFSVSHARFQCVPRTVSVCLTHGFSVSHARFQCVSRTVPVCPTHGFSVSHTRFQCVPRTVSVCPTHGFYSYHVILMSCFSSTYIHSKFYFFKIKLLLWHFILFLCSRFFAKLDHTSTCSFMFMETLSNKTS